MVTEIIIYELKPDMVDTFYTAFIEKSLPKMQKCKISVVKYGFSLDNSNIFHLIRTFESLESRNKVLEDFYNSEDWQLGARIDILKSIKEYKTTIF